MTLLTRLRYYILILLYYIVKRNYIIIIIAPLFFETHVIFDIVYTNNMFI